MESPSFLHELIALEDAKTDATADIFEDAVNDFVDELVEGALEVPDQDVPLGKTAQKAVAARKMFEDSCFSDELVREHATLQSMEQRDERQETCFQELDGMREKNLKAGEASGNMQKVLRALVAMLVHGDCARHFPWW